MDTQIVVRMPRELRTALERVAEQERRPVGNLVRVFLEDALAARKQKRR